MSDDEVVASYVPLRYLFLSPANLEHARRFPRPMRPYVHRDVMVEMWEESDNIHHYLMTEDGRSLLNSRICVKYNALTHSVSYEI